MSKIVWEFFFALFTSNDDSNFCKKMLIWFKKVKSIIKNQQVIVKALKSQFWSKLIMQNTAYTKLLNLEA